MSIKIEKREFELVGGHVALDLVNTLDFRFRESGALELITSYDDLLAFASQAGMISEERARKLGRAVSKVEAAAVLQRARALREALARVLYSVLEHREPEVADLGQLEQQFKEAWDASQACSGRWQPCVELGWGQEGRGVSVVGAGAGCKRVCYFRCSCAVESLRQRYVPMAVYGYEQESFAAVVRYEDLRQPDEGSQVPGAAAGRGSSRGCRLVASYLWSSMEMIWPSVESSGISAYRILACMPLMSTHGSITPGRSKPSVLMSSL